jgi:transcriptional regulator with XRE-family HTH domain
MTPDILFCRRRFGSLLAQLRHQKSLTLVQLGEKINLSHSGITAIEKGHRAVGSNLATRLAEALDISGEAREEFMMMAAATCVHQRLVGSAQSADPFVVHYVVKALDRVGTTVDRIQSAKLVQSSVNTPENGRMWRAIKQQFHDGVGEYLNQDTPSDLPILELDLVRGGKVYCALLIAKT